MSHTRCCDELKFFNGGTVGALTGKLEYDVRDIEDVPCIVEARFNGTAPAAGTQVFIYNGMYDGAVIRKGHTEQVTTAADIIRDYTAGLDSGFVHEFPGGMGRSIGILNQTSTALENVCISIRRLVTMTTEREGRNAWK